MIEIWRAIEGFETSYEVSDFGRVRSLLRKLVKIDGRIFHLQGRILKPQLAGIGYFFVCLGSGNPRYIHRLVAETFIRKGTRLEQTNHKDGIKTNNVSTNLEWVSHQENAIHSVHVLGNKGGQFTTEKLRGKPWSEARRKAFELTGR